MTKAIRRKSKIAIFDIDGTIFRSSLLIELTDALIQTGVFKASARRHYERAYRDWLDRKDTYEKYIQGVVTAFASNLSGVSQKRFMRIATQVVAFHQNRVYRYTRDLVRQLKKRGYFLLAISKSPKEILDIFCAKLGFDKVYGVIYEVNDTGHYTGKILHWDIISNKENVLERFTEKYGFSLRQSIGVGDTESDIDFLKKVSTPICFNPNKKLYEYAIKAGWEVVVERKDVIYKL